MFDPRVALIQVREKYASLNKEAVSAKWVKERTQSAVENMLSPSREYSTHHALQRMADSSRSAANRAQHGQINKEILLGAGMKATNPRLKNVERNIKNRTVMSDKLKASHEGVVDVINKHNLVPPPSATAFRR